MSQRSLSRNLSEKGRVLKTTNLRSQLSLFMTSIDASPMTVQGYRRKLLAFLKWLSEEGVKKPETVDVVAFKKFLIANSYSPNTINSYLTAVRRFFFWLEGANLYPNIAKCVTGPSKSTGFCKDALTKEEAWKLLESVDQATVKGKRDFAMLNLMLRRGPRTIELQRAKVKDLRRKGDAVVLYLQGKGRTQADEFIVVTEEVLKPIEDYLAARKVSGPEIPLFLNHSSNSQGKPLSTRSIRGIIKQILRNNGMDSNRLSAHSLRHTAITFALLGGASLQETRMMARHSDINSTLIYSHNIKRSKGVPESAVDNYLDEDERGD